MNTTIDRTVFTELIESMGADFIGELIDTYLEETPQLIAKLRQSLAEQNPEAFRRFAHSIKSSSASFGALGFSAQARDLEMIGMSGDLTGAGEKVEQLSSAYSQVAQALQELKNEP
jgi:HPt (histidine-containing phosphotransfer) domain-containing protein